jgi:hypothetical protein
VTTISIKINGSGIHLFKNFVFTINNSEIIILTLTLQAQETRSADLLGKNLLAMKDSWIQSIITQDQFRKIDVWVYELLKLSAMPDPLKNLDYCVLIRKYSSLNRQVIFSPHCFARLCEVQPEFLSFDAKTIPRPELVTVSDDNHPFVYWFGNYYYFLKICPAEDPK